MIPKKGILTSDEIRKGTVVGTSDPAGVLKKEEEEKKRLAEEDVATQNEFLSELNNPLTKPTKES